MENAERKLNFEVIPDGCWGYNLRTVLPKKLWDFLKKDVKEKADGKCEICGRKTHRLEAHERWDYDVEKGIIKLVDIVAVCKDCHSVIHIGRTQLVGDIERAEKHYMKVNGCNYAKFREDLGKANLRHAELNKVSEWAMDISFLKKYT